MMNCTKYKTFTDKKPINKTHKLNWPRQGTSSEHKGNYFVNRHVVNLSYVNKKHLTLVTIFLNYFYIIMYIHNTNILSGLIEMSKSYPVDELYQISNK